MLYPTGMGLNRLLTKDGDITFEGETYQLRAAINGGRLTAKPIRLNEALG